MKFIITLLAIFNVLAGHAENVKIEAHDPQAILAEVRKDLVSLRADFIQYELTQDEKRLDVNSGLVWMKSPSLFRWEYQQPFEQLIVADGTQVWVYDEDLDQVTVKEQNNNLNPIYVIINDELSKKHYDIVFEMTKDDVDWISLTPKVKSDDVKYVWLAVQNNLVQQIRVFNHFDQIMIFEFDNIKKNQELDEKLFKFDPPEGVDVIRALGESTTD